LNVETTKTLLGTLRKLGVGEELKRTRESRKIRQGHGKMRNSRYVVKKGPLIIYGDENNLVKRAARNLPGVDTCHVNRMNLLQLAPGGHLGRMLIWTKDAFSRLDHIFGKFRTKGIQKGGYVLNRSVMTVADLARIINSDSVQSKLRQVRTNRPLHSQTRKNPLKNRTLMKKLNPYDAVRREAQRKNQQERQNKRAAEIKKRRKDKVSKAARKQRKELDRKLGSDLLASYKYAEDVIARDEALDRMEDKEEEEDKE
jgi:large subunit ribosomal protein L4e